MHIFAHFFIYLMQKKTLRGIFMDCKNEIIKFDAVDTKKILTSVSGKEAVSPGAMVLSCVANACCGRCETLSGEAILEGAVNFTVVLNEEGEIRVCEHTERFAVNEKIDGIVPKTKMLSSANAQNVKAIVEAGNLHISANVEICATVISSNEAEVCSEFIGDDVIKKGEEICYSNVDFASNLRFSVNGETSLSPRLPEVERVLSTNATAFVEEAHIASGQLVFGGSIHFQTVYLSLDEFEPIVQVCDKIGFSQIIDVDALDATPEINLCVEEITAQVVTSEEGLRNVLSYSAMLCGYTFSFNKHSIEIIDDVFSTTHYVETIKKKIDTTLLNEKISSKISQHFDVMLPAGKTPIARINSVNFSPFGCKAIIENSRATIDASAEVSVIYTAAGTNVLDGFNVNVPLKIVYDDSQLRDVKDALIKLNLIEMQAMLSSGNEIEIRATMMIELIPIDKIEKEIISQINVGQMREPEEFGLVIYFAEDGETLWDIAKKFAISIDELLAINPDIKETVKKGDKLYIFRQLKVC